MAPTTDTADHITCICPDHCDTGDGAATHPDSCDTDTPCTASQWTDCSGVAPAQVLHYVAEGDVRGSCGHKHRLVHAATDCADRDARIVAGSGGGAYSDRNVRAHVSPDSEPAEVKELADRVWAGEYSADHPTRTDGLHGSPIAIDVARVENCSC